MKKRTEPLAVMPSRGIPLRRPCPGCGGLPCEDGLTRFRVTYPTWRSEL